MNYSIEHKAKLTPHRLSSGILDQLEEIGVSAKFTPSESRGTDHRGRHRNDNHSFRATGITACLKYGGTLEKAAAWPITPVPARRSLTTDPRTKSSVWGFEGKGIEGKNAVAGKA
jgi:hypothetical protein